MSGTVPDTLDSYLNSGGQGVPAPDVSYGCSCKGTWWYGGYKYQVSRPGQKQLSGGGDGWALNGGWVWWWALQAPGSMQ